MSTSSRPCTPPPPLGRGGIPHNVYLVLALQSSPPPPIAEDAAHVPVYPATPPRLARTVPVWDHSRSGALRHVGGGR